MKEPTLAINTYNTKEEELLGNKTMEEMNKYQNQYRVTDYDPACEDHNKIDRIIPVSPSLFKTIILCITAVFTGTLILFFIYWFPKFRW